MAIYFVHLLYRLGEGKHVAPEVKAEVRRPSLEHSTKDFDDSILSIFIYLCQSLLVSFIHGRTFVGTLITIAHGLSVGRPRTPPTLSRLMQFQVLNHWHEKW